MVFAVSGAPCLMLAACDRFRAIGAGVRLLVTGYGHSLPGSGKFRPDTVIRSLAGRQ